MFSHLGSNGTKIECLSRDLSTTLFVMIPKNLNLEHIVADIAEIIGWWTANIYPDLYEGFQGFDCLRFSIIRE